MQDNLKRICPYCKTEIKENEPSIICDLCNNPHHLECWNENNGCTTFGCSNLQPLETHTNMCKHCSALIHTEQKFCSNCGSATYDTRECATTIKIEKFNQNIDINKLKKKRLLICGGAIVGIMLLIFATGQIQKNLLTNRLTGSDWWTYSDDTKLILEFKSDEIEYSGEFGILGTQNIADLEYKVLNRNKIEVEGQEIVVEFDDDVVVFTPSFINSDSFSLWMED